MTSVEYWKQRTQRRLDESEATARKSTKQVAEYYQQALKNINAEINRIYLTYSNKTGLAVDELNQVITGSERANFLLNIQRSMREMGLNLGDVYDKGYLFRLSRLNALKEQVYWQIGALTNKESASNITTYNKIIQDDFRNYQKDVFDIYDYSPFGEIDKQSVREMLLDRWSGKNFSEIIWNTKNPQFAVDMQNLIGGALTMGQPYTKTAGQIADKFDVETWKATRLIRTESNYFYNQTEFQSMQEEGIKQYDYVADYEACPICEKLVGRYWLSEARVGVNYPPIHPNCRCDAQSVIPVRESDQKQGSVSDFTAVRQGERVYFYPQGSTSAQVTKDLGSNWTSKFITNLDKDKRVAKDYGTIMQRQMQVNKEGQIDYNAQLNQITRSYKGEQLQAKLAELVGRIPEDYPLREAIINTAKMLGMPEEKPTKAESADLQDDFEFYKKAKLTSIKEQIEGQRAVVNFAKEHLLNDVARQQEILREFEQRLADREKEMNIDSYKIKRDEKEKELNNAMKVLGIDQYPLTDYEKRVMVAQDIKLDPIPRRMGKGIGGQYVDSTRTFSYSKEGMNWSPEAKRNAFYHELGHAIDYQGMVGKARYSTLDSFIDFHKKTIDENFTVLRENDSVTGGKFDAYILKLPKKEYESYYNGIGHISYNDRVIRMKSDMSNYFTSNRSSKYYSEKFARFYSIYRRHYDEYKDKLPVAFKLMDEVTKGQHGQKFTVQTKEVKEISIPNRIIQSVPPEKPEEKWKTIIDKPIEYDTAIKNIVKVKNTEYGKELNNQYKVADKEKLISLQLKQFETNSIVGNNKQFETWQGTDKVVELWHGTSKEAKEGIMKEGFRQTLSGGAAYGSGTYLTPNKEVANAYGTSFIHAFVKPQGLAILNDKEDEIAFPNGTKLLSPIDNKPVYNTVFEADKIRNYYEIKVRSELQEMHKGKLDFVQETELRNEIYRKYYGTEDQIPIGIHQVFDKLLDYNNVELLKVENMPDKEETVSYYIVRGNQPIFILNK